MARVIVPPTPGDPEGGWFDLIDLGKLNSDHQDEYLDLADELRETKRRAHGAAAPGESGGDAGPGGSRPRCRLTRKELGPVRDLVERWVVTDSSYGIPLPKPLPLSAVNVLREALDGYFGALNGDSPKGNPASASSSGATSPEAAPAPLAE